MSMSRRGEAEQQEMHAELGTTAQSENDKMTLENSNTPKERQTDSDRPAWYVIFTSLKKKVAFGAFFH